MRVRSVGIVGGGQLARMTVQAAISLGIEVVVLARSFEESAARVCPRVLIGDPDDPARIRDLASITDVVTFDHELVDVPLIRSLERDGFVFAPRSSTMEISQSKHIQRRLFDDAELPGPRFRIASREDHLCAIVDDLGLPLVIKADRGGYDGRGVWIVETYDEGERIIAELNARDTTAVVEEHVAIDRELAILVSRSVSGDQTVFPLVETLQVNGQLDELLAPAPRSENVAERARAIAHQVAELTDLVGLLAVELFDRDGELLINEIATRPHNSGHYSIEGTTTSQFEQHLRSILGWPPGDTDMVRPFAATANILGPVGPTPERTDPVAGLEDGSVHVHWYEKEPRPNRKIGHVTVLDDSPETALGRARLAVDRITGGNR